MNATEAFEIAFLGRLKELAATAEAAAGKECVGRKRPPHPCFG